MEEVSRTEGDHHGPQDSALQHAGQQPAGEGDEAIYSDGHQQDMERGSRPPGPGQSRRTRLQEAQNHGEASHQDATNGQIHRGTGGAGNLNQPCPPLQVPEAARDGEWESQSEPAASSAVVEGGTATWPVDDPDQQLCLGTDPNQDQAAPNEGEHVGQCVILPFQAESIAGWLLSLGLANAGNQRLINAVAISFCGASPNLESQYGMSLAKAVIVYRPLDSQLENQEYEIIGGIAHKGIDQAGHLQAIGRWKGGWFLFNDNREAIDIGTEVPSAKEWICVWLAHKSWVALRTPRGWRTGTDMYNVDAAIEVSKRVWSLSQYPPELRRYMAAHCLICGGLAVTHEPACAF